MVDVKITNTSGTTFTFAAGEVSLVKSQINADVEPTAFPGSGPESALIFDFNGPLKTINITGNLFATSASRTDVGSTTTLLEQKQWLEQNIDGFQLPMTFTSNYESQSFDGSAYQTTQIMFAQIEFQEIAGEPETIPFVINFVVGS